ITQGGTFSDLRRECTERLTELPFFGFAIGGLGVGEPLTLRQQHLAENLEMLPEAKPRYVMGMGPAPEIWDTVEMGADMMDCVLPTRNGRNAQAFTFSGKMNLRNSAFKNDPRPIDPECACHACSRYSRSYIHHLFNVREMLAQTLTSLHNISFMIDLMRLIRESIKKGTFPEEKKKFMKNWKGEN
ncbi:MAG: tRNA guanosine(34) transglycosylase Tgt, partial [Candidatus Omnitrophota bacterium]